MQRPVRLSYNIRTHLCQISQLSGKGKGQCEPLSTSSRAITADATHPTSTGLRCALVKVWLQHTITLLFRDLVLFFWKKSFHMFVAIYIFSSDLIFFSGHTMILPHPYDQGLLIFHAIYKKIRKRLYKR